MKHSLILSWNSLRKTDMSMKPKRHATQFPHCAMNPIKKIQNSKGLSRNGFLCSGLTHAYMTGDYFSQRSICKKRPSTVKLVPQYSEKLTCKNECLSLTAFQCPCLDVQEDPERSANWDDKAAAPAPAHCLSCLIESFTAQGRISANDLQVCILFVFQFAYHLAFFAPTALILHSPLRNYYPKTTIPMARDVDPVRFRSIADTYKWASLFLERVATCFGQDWLTQRLARWSWNLSTCFTGVGCAEQARAPVSHKLRLS